MKNAIFSHYRKAEAISMLGEKSKIMVLPKEKREELLGRVRDIGREYGVRVKICACKNPDLASGACSIAGDWIKPAPGPAQSSLFEEQERS